MIYDHPANLPAHVQSTIESICELGCDSVNDIIDALGQGNSVRETAGLDKTERQRVLLELKEIMAVYDSNQT
jgi:hypothetical protein